MFPQKKKKKDDILFIHVDNLNGPYFSVCFGVLNSQLTEIILKGDILEILLLFSSVIFKDS